MKAKPILFSTEMVQTILAGRKTVTRRPIKPQPAGGIRRSVFVKSGLEDMHGYEIKWPCRIGDVRYVQETWARISDWAEVDQAVGLFDGYIYRAGWRDAEHPRWRPSIHMPREAARLFLRVTDVRTERLQDITEKQAVAEGLTPLIDQQTGAVLISAKGCFHALWDFIYAAKGCGWGENPWVFVFEFEKTGN